MNEERGHEPYGETVQSDASQQVESLTEKTASRVVALRAVLGDCLRPGKVQSKGNTSAAAPTD